MWHGLENLIIVALKKRGHESIRYNRHNKYLALDTICISRVRYTLLLQKSLFHVNEQRWNSIPTRKRLEKQWILFSSINQIHRRRLRELWAPWNHLSQLTSTGPLVLQQPRVHSLIYTYHQLLREKSPLLS